jgi:hypothetical protein
MVVLEIERSIDRRSERIAVWEGLKSGNKTHVGAAGERSEERVREREYLPDFIMHFTKP